LELKKSKRKDYYKILELTKSCTDDEIKKGYKKAALKWHPDKNSSTEETKTEAEKIFKDIGEAYSVLSDPQKR
jgi:DnaJ family protein C protein 7